MNWSRRADGPLAGILALLLVSCARGSTERTPTPTPAETAPPTVSPRPTPACEGALPPASGLAVFGAEARDFLADRFSLASGDFNGDGRDDLLLGAPLADGPNNSRESGGEAYVILGRDSPPSVIDLSDGKANLTVYPEGPGINLGFTVAAGDVNGDGIDDVLVGARFATAGATGVAGKAYAIFGGPELRPTVDTAKSQQDVTVAGIDSGDQLSIALGSGDVDGDGVDDIILGASGAAGPGQDRPSAGEVYVVRGSRELHGMVDLAQQPPYFTVYGAAAGDNLPNHVAGVDFDGDGRDELLLGAPFAEGTAGQEDAGRGYIVPVPQEGGALDLAEGQGFTTLIGADRADHLGFYVAGGDVNGDGMEDAIVGARDADGADNARNNAGEVHVLLGGRGQGPAAIDLAQQQADAVIYGVNANDSLGFSVATGDVNGDGLADLLMGSPNGDSCEDARGQGGEAYVLFGRSNLPAATDLAKGDYDLAFFGTDTGDNAGFSVASGDFNGDGIDEVLVGALLADGPDNRRLDSGEAYVILGGER